VSDQSGEPMPIPMMGRLEVEVVEVAPVSIHGDVYHDVTGRIRVAGSDDEPRAARLRLPSHVTRARVPEPGDRLEVSLLMGQIDGVRFLEDH